MKPRHEGVHRGPSRIVVAGLLAFAMAVTVVSVTLVGPSATARVNPEASAERYDGEALLLGLFFGVGPIADRYPKLVLTDLEETPENLDAVAAAIARVESRSLGFVEEFGSAMYSDDPRLVAEVATDAIWRLAGPRSIDESGSGTISDPFGGLWAITDGKPHAEPDSDLQAWAGDVVRALSMT